MLTPDCEISQMRESGEESEAKGQQEHTRQNNDDFLHIVKMTNPRQLSSKAEDLKQGEILCT
jgi:hypothetical protein